MTATPNELQGMINAMLNRMVAFGWDLAAGTRGGITLRYPVIHDGEHWTV